MRSRLCLVAVGLAGWLTASAVAADDKVEVLARGPVHEAYAEPSEREPAPTPIVAKEPPKPIEELPPDQKPDGDNVQWMSGYWAWDEDRKDFIWVSGFWRNAPPGRSWVPGSWRQAGDGWQWSGGFWAQANPEGKAEVEYLPKPPAPLDVEGPATPAPSENHVYAPGTWVYRERYVWRPGYWYEHNPGYVWTSAHYRWTPAGYVFIDDYWDYPLDERGILFAPVYVPPVIYSAPAYVYTPTYVVREDCLFGAFFCRRGYGSYYFGDYFAPSYASFGFSAWCGNVGLSFSIGRGYYDPLFSYYRSGFRHDPFWRTGVFDLYAGRYRGDYLRPPINLIQQNTIINNITNVTNVTNVNTNNVNMLTSLSNADRGGRRRLTQVPEAERQQFQAQAGANRQLAARRAEGEARLASRPGGAGGKTSRPTALTLDTPPAPKGVGRPKVADPKLGGAPPRPTITRPTAPPPPKPSPVGKIDPKSSVIGGPKGGNLGGNAAIPSRPNLKPPPAPKLGGAAPKFDPQARPGIQPKGSGANVVPKIDRPLPKSGGLDIPRPTPQIDRPGPKSVAPIGRPPALKPPPSSPPVTIPKPSSPIVPRGLAPQNPVPRMNPAPRPIPRPGGPGLGSAPSAPRIAPPAISRPAPRPVAPPSRPAAPPPRPGKKGKG